MRARHAPGTTPAWRRWVGLCVVALVPACQALLGDLSSSNEPDAGTEAGATDAGTTDAKPNDDASAPAECATAIGPTRTLSAEAVLTGTAVAIDTRRVYWSGAVDGGGAVWSALKDGGPVASPLPADTVSTDLIVQNDGVAFVEERSGIAELFRNEANGTQTLIAKYDGFAYPLRASGDEKVLAVTYATSPGSTSTGLWKVPGAPADHAYDPTRSLGAVTNLGHEVYAGSSGANGHRIERFDDSLSPVVFAEADGMVVDLAIDDERVYWATSTGTIASRARVAAAGTGVVNLASVAGTINRIALDRRCVYASVSATGAGKIVAVAKAGGPSGDVTAVSGAPWGLAVDDTGIYWMNRSAQAMEYRAR